MTGEGTPSLPDLIDKEHKWLLIVRDKTHVEALSSVAGSISGAMSNHTHSAKAAR